MKNKKIYVKSASGKIEVWFGGKKNMLKDYLNRTGDKITWEEYLFNVGNYSVVDGRKYRGKAVNIK